MAIDEKYIELINADIDGEIGPDEKTELDAFLASSDEGRTLREELSGLCSTLDNQDMLDAPPHVRHIVMNQLPGKRREPESESWLQSLFAVPALRYAATFAAGVVMTVVIVDSGQIQQSRFDEVTGLVGTMSGNGEYGPAVDSATINRTDVAGVITLRRADPIMIIDFNLSTNGPIDIVASYADRTLWFNGFAQLEATGTSILAEDGRISIQVEGNRRYAVYLHNADSRGVSIDLAFFANGEPVHQATLEYSQGGS